MNSEKIFALLHFAQKARTLVIGKTAVQLLLKKKRVALTIVALDASEKLRQQIETDCRRINVPIYIFSTKEQLGDLCGRKTVATLAVTDKNLAAGLRKEFL